MVRSDELKKYIDEDLQYIQFNSRYVKEDEQNAIKTEVISSKLIPQFWWGDVSNTGEMKAIILGRNPSLKIKSDIRSKLTDLADNASDRLKKMLNDNLNIYDRSYEINNLLLNEEENAYFSYWWKNNAFSGLKLQSMNGIAIYNLFGFYSSKFPDNIDYNQSHICKVDGIRNYIRKQIENADNIFIMWKSSWQMWKDVLNTNGDIFEGKNIYIVNGNCSRNTQLQNAVKMSIEELDDIHKEERKAIIKAIFDSKD